MASSYFDEHNCEPLADGQTPDHFLHLARLLIDCGVGNEWILEFERLMGEDRKPPASKHFIDNLTKINDFKSGEKCCICLKEYVINETVALTCGHKFHCDCIVPWLKLNNSCPLCREEFPTDDEQYEMMKKEKKRKETMLSELHDSMFA